MRKPALTEKVMRGLLILQAGMIQQHWEGEFSLEDAGFTPDDESDANTANAWIIRMAEWRDWKKENRS